MGKKILIAVLAVLLAMLLFFGGFFALFRYALTRPDVTDPAKYERTLKKLHYGRNEEIAHFPDGIPDGASDVRFLWQEGVLQGGSVLMLSYTAEEGDLAALRERLKTAGSSEKIETVPEEGLYRSYLPEGFPVEEAERYWFRAEPYQPGSWNHGQYSLALVDEETRQAVFLWERW